MTDAVTKPDPTIDTQTKALNYVGSEDLTLGTVSQNLFPKGFTLSVWIRPAILTNHIEMFADVNYGGKGLMFEPGRYNDLTKFGTDVGNTKSVKVSGNYQVILFSETGCRGQHEIVSSSNADMGKSRSNPIKSLIVIDNTAPMQTTVLVHADPNCMGETVALDVRRYENLTFLTQKQSFFRSLQAFGDLEVSLFDKQGCWGDSKVFKGKVNDIGDWSAKVASLAVTLGQRKTKIEPAKVDEVFTVLSSGSDFTFEIRQEKPASTIRPPRCSFMGKTLKQGKWHQLAATYDGVQVVLYLNGVQVASYNPKGPIDLFGPCAIGHKFQGDVAVVQAHSYPQQAHELAKTRFDLPRADDPNLVFGYLLDGADSTRVMNQNSVSSGVIPSTGCTWVHATFPRSLLSASLAQHALSLAQKKASAARSDVLQQGKIKTQSAHEKAKAKVSAANKKAIAVSHAARFTAINGIAAGVPIARKYNTKDTLTAPARPDKIYIDAAKDPFSAEKYWVTFCSLTGLSMITQTESLADIDNARNVIHREQRIHAIAIGALGPKRRLYVFWVEGDGALYCSLCQRDTMEEKVVLLVQNAAPGPHPEWFLTFDSTNSELTWSNGHEIWRGSVTDDRKMENWGIFVSHGNSPHPTALVQDTSSGVLYWIDKELGRVRSCTKTGDNIRDLYDAPNPREAIALDFIDASSMNADQHNDPDITQKRLYWNAEYQPQIEVANIDTAGEFLTLTKDAGTGVIETANAAFSDISSVKTTRDDEMEIKPILESGPDEFLWPYFYNEANELCVLSCVTYPPSAGTSVTIQTYHVQNVDTGVRSLLPDVGSSTELSVATQLSVDPTGTTLAYVHGNSVTVINLSTHEVLRVIDPAETGLDESISVHTVTFSADGQRIALGSVEGHFLIVDAKSPGNLVHIGAVHGHDGSERLFVGRAEGKDILFVLSRHIGTVDCWDFAKGETVSVSGTTSNGLAYVEQNADATKLVTVDFGNTLRLWDMETGKCEQVFTGHTDQVSFVIFHPDNKRLISGGADQIIKIWDRASGRCLQNLHGHKELVLRAFVSKDGNTLYSYGFDLSYSWDLGDADTMLNFDGRSSFVDLGPMQLDTEKGFSAVVQFKADNLHRDTVLFALGNGKTGGHAENLSLKIWAQGQVSFTSEGNGVTRRLDAPLKFQFQKDKWQTVVVVVEPGGNAEIFLNGTYAHLGLEVSLPRQKTLLRNFVGASNGALKLPFCGQIRLARFFNEALSQDERKQLAAHPNYQRSASVPRYNRDLVTYSDGHSYLMSGTTDGSEKQEPLIGLALDRGMGIESDLSKDYTDLVGAQRERKIADVLAIEKRAKAHLDAKIAMAKATTENQAKHSHAQAILKNSSQETTTKRSQAHQHLNAAHQKSREKVSDAKYVAQKKRDKAHGDASELKANANAKARSLKQVANAKMSKAQAKKAENE